MRRRVCLPLLAACVAALPLGAAAQQPRIPVVGFLGISNPQTAAPWLAQWHEGLRDGGFVEGRNLTVEYRWAESDRTRVPGLVTDLVGRRIDIFVTPDPGAAVTAKQAATSVPIVFVHVADPVGLGLVASLSRPGGNVTGIANFEGLAAKQLQLLRGLVPAARRIGYLVDHKSSFWRGELESVIDAGKTLGVDVILLTAMQPEEIEPALDAAKRTGIGAVLVQNPSTLFFSQRKRVQELLARYALPATCPPTMAPAQGCLMRYSSTNDVQLAGGYVARILKGAKPADLPVMQPTKFALDINLRTAKALGLSVPPALLAAADEVIE